MHIYRATAFSSAGRGGNPAGVVVTDLPIPASEMQSTARDIGYSETAFLHPEQGSWRVRYFAPEMEVPFCGHATIAAGAILGVVHGTGRYALLTNSGMVPVEASRAASGWRAMLVSPVTHVRKFSDAYLERLYECFGLHQRDLDESLPSMLIHAGANHALIALKSRRRLSHIGYAFQELAELQAEHQLATVSLIYREAVDLFHARNPFAAGGIYEDPATGAAAAALAGYLRGLRIKAEGSLRVIQGEDMGRRSEIFVDYDATPNSGVQVAGEVSILSSVHQSPGLAPNG